MANNTSLHGVNGPHINPASGWVCPPVHVYGNAALAAADIRTRFKGSPVIYQWINLITGQTYVGSALHANKRLVSYWQGWVLNGARGRRKPSRAKPEPVRSP